jgi:hypothetical protein
MATVIPFPISPDETSQRLKRRPLNDPAEFVIEPFSPLGGFNMITLTADEAAIYDANPDAWCAQHFGLTLKQYYEWNESGGVPFCGAITKAGKPCRNALSDALEPQEWLEWHRRYCCAAHSKMRMR